MTSDQAMRPNHEAPSSALPATRRYFFDQCRVGLGAIALSAAIVAQIAPPTAIAAETDPLAPRPGHFPAARKSVIYLFMAGGPSQFELFDYKPKLQELDGQPAPDSFFPKDKSFAFIGKGAKLLGTRRTFARHGQVRHGAQRTAAAPGTGR